MKRRNEPNITPAALGAFVRGDMDNFRVASTPGGIEAQEKAGQTTFVANATLPKDGLKQDVFEKMGFKIGEPVDGIFVSVTMPVGWTKKATDHSMWSKLLDDKGRERASIFYKAAFYNRNAHISLTRRYNTNSYIGCKEDGTPTPKDNYNPPYFAVVAEDCGKEIKRFGIVRRDDYSGKDELEKRAVAWLTENFPKCNDPAAYWE